MKASVFVIVLFATQTASTLVLAEDQSTAVPVFTPANFVEGKKSLQNLIKFPKVEEDVSVIVTCYSRGTARGYIRRARCSTSNDSDLKFTLVVSRACKSARLTPATVNGRKEEINFQFSVIFTKNGESEEIAVYPHNRNNVDKFGLDYVGAQLYKMSEFPKGCYVVRGSIFVVSIVSVGTDGKPKTINLYKGPYEITGACERIIMQRFKDALWIPAFHDGSPVESTWTNPFFTYSKLYVDF